jgi:phosphate/sulfate permease
MLEIVGIFLLARKIREKLEPKGIKPTKYIVIMILLWVGLEFLFAFLAAMVFYDEPYMAYPFGIAGAVIGAIIGYRIALAASKTAEPLDVLDSDLD